MSNKVKNIGVCSVCGAEKEFSTGNWDTVRAWCPNCSEDEGGEVLTDEEAEARLRVFYRKGMKVLCKETLQYKTV